MDNMRHKLAFILVVGTLTAFGVFPFMSNKCEREILLLVIGALGTNLANIVGYYFGSSASSHAKDATIAAAASREWKTENDCPQPRKVRRVISE
jgi:hypothetical protein